MRNTKFTRFISLALAVLFLVSGGVIAVQADTSGSSVTDKNITDYINASNTISYDDYVEQECKEVPKGNQQISFNATSDWVFESSNGQKVELKEGVWTLTVTAADGTTTSYTEAEAIAAGYKMEELVHVATYDGKQALYTPDIGSTTWRLNLKESGITAKTLYSIRLNYYPIANKTASIEREFYINGQAPFTEARSLTLAKRWGSYQADGKTALTAVFEPTKKQIKELGGTLDAALAALESNAKAAGLNAYQGVQNAGKANERKVLFVEQPSVVTPAANAFIETYGLRFFITDMMANELRPTMVQTPEWMSYTLRDSGGYYAEDFQFALMPDENGMVEMTLVGVNEPVALSEIVLVPIVPFKTYSTYEAELKAALGVEDLPAGTDVIRIESEYTSNTSTNVVYPIEDRSDAMTSPVDTGKTLLNTIGAEKWETAGQWVQYRFSVDNAGMYEIFSRFKQSYLNGMYVGRTLKIYTSDKNGIRINSEDAYKTAYGLTNAAGYYNGVPFEEVTDLRFDYNNGWQVKSISNEGKDGKTYPMYFEKGVVYTLQLEVTLGSMSELIRNVENILNALNDDYLSIIKLTGSSPDDYRDYNFSRLLTNTLVDMVVQGLALEEVSEQLKADETGVASSYTGICDKLSVLLDKMGRDEDTIAKNLSNFKSYVGSLGTFLTDAKTQPLQLDYLQIQPSTAKAPKAKANFFQALGHELSGFFMSFIRDYNSMGAMESDEGADDTARVSVWLAYGRDQSQVIRNLCTNKFTPDHQVAVDLQLITGGTLLPSILAGMGPDAYLGLGQTEVINYAIRGALMNVEGLPGFEDSLKNFNEAAMMVLGTEDSDGVMHYYGLPETQGFPMMFLRTDILANLNIEIPKTWEDIYVAQSKLESNNMEIGVTTDYKIFLYQMGGELFADNGMRINLDSIVGLEAFETMCNMFTQYSFPYKYEAANRFRTGEMPIIISNYTALYNHLKVFATELDNCWTFVPLPGYESAENNCSVSTASAAVLIRKGEDINSYLNAWNFVKWYTGAECQTEYAQEMVAIIGDSAKHATANRVALESMPWTREEYVEVKKQFENLASIPNYPGYYIIDRYTEFAFLSAYNDKADPNTELLSYINIINKEITRKREEFKLETLQIGQKLSEKRSLQIKQAMDALRALLPEGETKYDGMITAANYAMANDRIDQLRTAADDFAATLDPNAKATYFVNVGKQTAEPKDGGYKINSLNEQQLVYFISEALIDMADALASY